MRRAVFCPGRNNNRPDWGTSGTSVKFTTWATRQVNGKPRRNPLQFWVYTAQISFPNLVQPGKIVFRRMISFDASSLSAASVMRKIANPMARKRCLLHRRCQVP